MDLVSIETPSENDLIEELIAGGNDNMTEGLQSKSARAICYEAKW